MVQRLGRIAVQPVSDQEHNRPLPHHPPRPIAIEVMQTGTDARATLPILRLFSGSGKGRVHIPRRQLPGDIGQSRTKGKGMHLCPARPLVIGDSMEKMQNHSAILTHRT